MSEPQNPDVPPVSSDQTLSYNAGDQSGGDTLPQNTDPGNIEKYGNIPNIDTSTLTDAPSENASGQLVTDTRGFWSKANAVMDTSPLEQVMGGLDSLLTHGQMTSQNPFVSDTANAIFHANAAFNRFLYSMTTPGQLGVVLGAGEFKAFAAAVNLWYGGRGAKDLFSLNTDEPWTDRLSGGVQLALSLAGLKSISRTELRQSIQNGFNISGDLVQKVADKIDQSHAKMAAFIEEMDNASKAEIAQAQNLAKGARLEMSRVLSDAADEALVIKQHTEALYNILFSKATTPVTSVSDLRATIINTMADHGVPAKAIPAKVFRWLPRINLESRTFTADEEVALYDIKKWISQKKYGAETIRGMLLDNGFDSDQIDLLMSTVAPDMVSREASAEMVQNTKNELYEASQSNAGTPIGLALGDASVRVDKMNDRYFAKKPGGPEALKDAREAYMQYKNGVGQGIVQDLLFAKEQNDRNIEKRIEFVLSQPGGNEIRSVLAGMGIDISPLEKITADQKTFSESSAAHAQALEESANKTIEAIDMSRSIIHKVGDLSGLAPGQSIEEGAIAGTAGLAKKTNYEIRLAAIHEFNKNAKEVGIKNVGPLVSTLIGGVRLLAGSTFGLFALGNGVTRMSISSLLNKPTFQNWIIQEAEVDPYARARVIRALKDDKTANLLFGYLNESALPHDGTKLGTNLIPSNVNAVKTGIVPQALQQAREPANPNRIVHKKQSDAGQIQIAQ